MNCENQLPVLNCFANRLDDGENPLRKAHLKHETIQFVGLESVRNEATKVMNILERNGPSRDYMPREPLRLPNEAGNDFRTAAHAVRPDSCHPGSIDILCSRNIQLAGGAS